eukprot:GCRY01002262.1.p1 GENE.GCRY01002262.1~~GCRY01002262.1.p1  ORF type:complete len:359 (-),score=43.08 GCRY01002262.1:170-1246(-)
MSTTSREGHFWHDSDFERIRQRKANAFSNVKQELQSFDTVQEEDYISTGTPRCNNSVFVDFSSSELALRNPGHSTTKTVTESQNQTSFNEQALWLIERGTTFLRLGNFNSAAHAFQSVFAGNPRELRPRSQLALCALKKGHFEESMLHASAVVTALRTQPLDHPATAKSLLHNLLRRGTCFAALNLLPCAIADFSFAVALSPQKPALQEDLLLLKQCHLLVRQEGFSSKQIEEQGRQAFLAKDYEQAKSHFQVGQRLYPSMFRFYANYAACELQLSNFESCLHHTRIALQLLRSPFWAHAFHYGDNEAFAFMKSLVRAAQCHAALGSRSEAIAALSFAVQLDCGRSASVLRDLEALLG